MIKEKPPLFFICAVDAVITMIAQHAGLGQAGPFSLALRLENALVSYAQYVRQAFWPANLAVLYIHPFKIPRVAGVSSTAIPGYD
jgi:protein O-mannosyl-transferase